MNGFSLIFTVLFCAYCAWLTVMSVTTESTCLARGYPSYNVTWNMKPYCIKRLDQTDVVVPLEQTER